MVTTLARELAAFRKLLPQLLADPAHRDRFALIHGDAFAGSYPTFDAALAAGYDQFGLDPFMVKEITEHEVPKYFSRNLTP